MDKPPLTDNIICVHQGGPKRVTRYQAGGVGSWDVKLDSVSVIPAFTANRWHTEGPIAFSHLIIGPTLLDHFAREEFDRDTPGLALIDRVGVPDVCVAQLMNLLQADTVSALSSSLRREGLLTSLMVILLCRHSSLSRSASSRLAQPRGGLAGWQLRRVIDYLAAHVSRDVASQELTNLTGLSRAHFFRAFRQSTGLAPGRYHLDMRIEHAKQKLREPHVEIETVATTLGFGNATSFSRTFRRIVGESPLAWRRKHGGATATDSQTDLRLAGGQGTRAP